MNDHSFVNLQFEPFKNMKRTQYCGIAVEWEGRKCHPTNAYQSVIGGISVAIFVDL